MEVGMKERPPVLDWATDFDHNHRDWASDPYSIWDDLRDRCPVAHTDRYRGVYMPVRSEDMRAIAYAPEHFSSRRITILDGKPPISAPLPPVTSDPPVHRAQRMLLLPAFNPEAIDTLRPITRALCNDLIDGFIANGHCDAAADYAKHVPMRVISRMLGISERDHDKFTVWVRKFVDDGITNLEVFKQTVAEMDDFFAAGVEARKGAPRNDLISYLMAQSIDGKPLTLAHMQGTLRLLLLAGIDTTWSAIGLSLLHLARHHEDARRLASDPALMPTAIEEFLRVYAPVSVGRLVVKDAEVGGCPFKAGQMVLLPYPAANRDPEKFPDPDTVVLDRLENRHSTFGLGIHRCIGSNLARMELTVAIEEWLKRIPDFKLSDETDFAWSPGLVRGPRRLPVTFPAKA
jgi:cytochrome P450